MTGGLRRRMAASRLGHIGREREMVASGKAGQPPPGNASLLAAAGDLTHARHTQRGTCRHRCALWAGGFTVPPDMPPPVLLPALPVVLLPLREPDADSLPPELSCEKSDREIVPVASTRWLACEDRFTPLLATSERSIAPEGLPDIEPDEDPDIRDSPEAPDAEPEDPDEGDDEVDVPEPDGLDPLDMLDPPRTIWTFVSLNPPVDPVDRADPMELDAAALDWSEADASCIRQPLMTTFWSPLPVPGADCDAVDDDGV